ncbi:unnamed protein product [Staurois parvus]|uniref:Uncharacterized protein n=1 Tax=Staurois parvus TaxID=386267 RepID=A0ABN9EW69_9NEOB|nr:unnamed protein product [Staurois parvus]
MRPLPRPRTSPPADAGIRLPCSSPCERRDARDVQGAGTAANLNIFRNCHFLRNDISNHFTYILSLVLCPVPCLHFDCSFCLETEKSPWCPKSVPFGQKRF